ncbi:MAG: hypothetical protein CBC09_01535 [Cellvibrionales bacterium TMED49]|nr:dihydrolipoamide dehydrogenase [Porticoccaceae bacterium]OUU39810.1 MAG: hypothetical protein CBC09_01535 [Cellvibrionales bacterium TMED49]
MLSIFKIPRDVISRGLKTAIVVGTILLLINQWHALFGSAEFRWRAAMLTYIVPFTVFIYSYISNLPSSSD